MKKAANKKTVYPERSRRVFVGMSGGVDSSVAAALLKKQGYNVVGVHLKCFNVDGCAADDAEDARRAAEHLAIPFYTFDYEQEYKDLVVKYMVDGYKKGITPNPDVMCNKEIKFGLFYKKAMEMGADFVATGHYVKLRQVKSYKLKVTSLSLAIARDLNKDQSYFLWAIKSEQLSHCLFPIGDYKKPQVRKLAEKFGLHNAAKKDSQGICFLGQVSLPDFLSKYIKPKKGDIVLAPFRHSEQSEESPRVIGEHRGAHFYTIGQRHGLRVSYKVKGKSYKGDTKPHYVVSKDVKKNIVVVAEGEDNPALYRKEIGLTDVNLFSSVIASLPAEAGEAKQSHKSIPVFARVRYRQPLQSAVLTLNLKLKTGELKFHRPMKFVAPGQSAVFYDRKGAVLGGGIIR